MAEAPGQDGKPQPALEPCQLNAPGRVSYLPAKCTTLTVFEDRAARSGRTIDLHIAVVPAISRSPAPDPLFFLAGGPGPGAGAGACGGHGRQRRRRKRAGARQPLLRRAALCATALRRMCSHGCSAAVVAWFLAHGGGPS